MIRYVHIVDNVFLSRCFQEKIVLYQFASLLIGKVFKETHAQF